MKKHIIISILTALIGYGMATLFFVSDSDTAILFIIYPILAIVLERIYKIEPKKKFKLFISVFWPPLLLFMFFASFATRLPKDLTALLLTKSFPFALTTSALFLERFAYKNSKDTAKKTTVQAKSINIKKVYVLTAVIGCSIATALCFIPITLEIAWFYIIYIVYTTMTLNFVFNEKVYITRFRVIKISLYCNSYRLYRWPYGIFIIVALILNRFISFDTFCLIMQITLPFVTIASILILEKEIFTKNYLQKSRN